MKFTSIILSGLMLMSLAHADKGKRAKAARNHPNYAKAAKNHPDKFETAKKIRKEDPQAARYLKNHHAAGKKALNHPEKFKQSLDARPNHPQYANWAQKNPQQTQWLKENGFRPEKLTPEEREEVLVNYRNTRNEAQAYRQTAREDGVVSKQEQENYSREKKRRVENAREDIEEMQKNN